MSQIKTIFPAATGPETRGGLEVSKHRTLVAPYVRGDGLDLGCSHDPVSGFAIRIDRDPDRAHLCGDVTRLKWFADGAFDYVHSSHVLEDFELERWPSILAEWARVLKPGGFLVIAVPDHERFRAAVAGGQGDNKDHRHESRLGEVPVYLHGWRIVVHGFVSSDPREYSIITVAQKPSGGDQVEMQEPEELTPESWTKMQGAA